MTAIVARAASAPMQAVHPYTSDVRPGAFGHWERKQPVSPQPRELYPGTCGETALLYLSALGAGRSLSDRCLAGSIDGATERSSPRRRPLRLPRQLSFFSKPLLYIHLTQLVLRGM